MRIDGGVLLFDDGVLDALADQIAVVDADGVIVGVNRAWREFAVANGGSVEVEHSVGLNYLSVCGAAAEDSSGGDAQAAAAGIRAVLSGAVDKFELEYPCHSPDEHRWFQLSVTPLAGGHEGGAAVVVCHHNITQRRVFEERLRQSEERAAITLQSIGDGVIVTDASGLITSMNPTAARLTGWAVADAVGRSLPEVFRIVNAQSRLIVSNPVELVIELGDVVGLANHTVLLARDGREYQIADSAAPIRDRGGEIVGVVLVFSDVTEEYRTRESLATTAALLERTGEMARIGGWERDLVTGERVWSSEIFRIFEIDPRNGATKDRAMDDFLALWAKEQLHAAIERGVATGTGWDLELPVVTAQGRPIWVRAQGETVVVDGVMVKVRGAVQDITARREADEALRAGAERLRAIFDTEPECVKVVGTDGALLEMNAAGLRMLEADSVDEVRSRKLSGFIVPEDQAAFAGLHRRVMDGQDGVLEFEVIGLRGTRRRLETHATPMRDATGKVTLLLGITRDVTERAHTRQQLADAAALMEQAGEIARIGAVSFDLRTRKSSVSANVRTLLELDEHDTPVAEDAFAPFLPPETQQLIQRRLDAAISSGTEWDFELPLVTGKGRTIWARLRGVVEFDNNGVATALRGMLQDVTERRRLEAQLLQAAKTESIGRLAGGVAHDFNNMLTVIIAGADIALRELHPIEPARVHLDQIRSAAERSAELTRQLLAFARQQTAEPRIIDPNNTVTATTSMLHRLIGEDITLTWHADPDLWPIRIDPSQFDQVLTNLVVNARDAITATGTRTGMISITASNTVVDDNYCATHWYAHPGDHLRLTVTDNGAGIDKPTQRNIFEPFFTTKEPGTGTGLGLSTVYGIVEQNNGFITVTSTPGNGATFEVFFPRHDGPVDPDPDRPALTTDIRSHETILVVEDEPAILKVITRILETDGYTVLAASNAADAITIAHEHNDHIDLLLTDVVMPDMTGRALADALTAAGIHTRHLYMSGYSADIITERGVLHPDVHFIQKPFTVNALTTKIRDTLDTEPHPTQRPTTP